VTRGQRRCPICKGQGKHPSLAAIVVCEDCGGTGSMLPKLPLSQLIRTPAFREKVKCAGIRLDFADQKWMMERIEELERALRDAHEGLTISSPGGYPRTLLRERILSALAIKETT
jgi:hypothetical protein